ncbi:MAG: SdiA-regulated domain-containing protein [Ignavibacteriaceae bacterium]
MRLTIPKIFLIILIAGNYILPQSHLNDYNYKNPKRFRLSAYLKEISGLAATEDNRIFTHDDEKGIIYQLDYRNGKIVKRFSVANKIPDRDFEGIAIAKDKFYLITSSGDIYEFNEAENGKNSKSKIYRTGLTVSYNIEGLCFDSSTNSLLIACKGFPGKNLKGYRAVYSYDLKEKKLNKKPRFLISLKYLDKRYRLKNFSPSAIEYNSATGTFFILSSHVKAVIEVSTKGIILNGISLPGNIHAQPEGLTFTKDMKMIISDEGRGGRGTITVYQLKD